MMTIEEKKARAEARKEAKRAEKKRIEIEAEKNQKPVKSLTIAITWTKSRLWGMNPHAEAKVEYHDGTFNKQDGFTASGCGYDKESTVIAQIFNQFLKYKLHDMAISEKPNKPYGMTRLYYDGGIGTSCYRAISEFIGGKFESIASGKTFDVFKYTE